MYSYLVVVSTVSSGMVRRRLFASFALASLYADRFLLRGGPRRYRVEVTRLHCS